MDRTLNRVAPAGGTGVLINENVILQPRKPVRRAKSLERARRFEGRTAMNPTCTLYEIEYELIYLLDTLESLSPEDEEARVELEEAITRAVEAQIRKVDGISHMLAHFESQAELAGGGEVKRLQGRKKAFETLSGEARKLCAERDAPDGGQKAGGRDDDAVAEDCAGFCIDHRL